jgi:hypothetical protein
MKKTLLLVVGILILQMFSSCKAQFSTAELESNFTPEQIGDLKKISDFFRTQICINSDSDFRACYERIPHDYMEAYGSGFFTNINFEEQKELYDQISQTTFDEIWMFCETTYYPKEIKAKSLCANATGKYQKFLTDLGKRNLRIAKYAERIEAFGDYSGSDINYREIIKDKQSFDLEDPNIQLILAIHYLSLNDQETRNKTLMSTRRPQFE